MTSKQLRLYMETNFGPVSNVVIRSKPTTRKKTSNRKKYAFVTFNGLGSARG